VDQTERYARPPNRNGPACCLEAERRRTTLTILISLRPLDDHHDFGETPGTLPFQQCHVGAHRQPLRFCLGRRDVGFPRNTLSYDNLGGFSHAANINRHGWQDFSYRLARRGRIPLRSCRNLWRGSPFAEVATVLSLRGEPRALRYRAFGSPCAASRSFTFNDRVCSTLITTDFCGGIIPHNSPPNVTLGRSWRLR
jgi:hypothetical protein